MRNWLNNNLPDEVGNASDRKGTRALIDSIMAGIWIVIGAIGILLAVDFAGHRSNFQLGTFGDFFGGVLNPLLTFLTVVGLAVNIVLQRVQIIHARVESAKHEVAAKTQAFENTFFQMLTLHNNIVQELKFDPSLIPYPAWSEEKSRRAGRSLPRGTPATGRAVFPALLLRLTSCKEPNETEADAYRRFDTAHHNVLDQYFRNIEQILKMLGAFALEDDRKHAWAAAKYTDILKSQLSDKELVVLFLHSRLRAENNELLLYRIKDLAILEHMHIDHDPATNRLSLPGLDQNLDAFLHDFFGKDDTNPATLLPGAFGQSSKIRIYLKNKNVGRQG